MRLGGRVNAWGGSVLRRWCLEVGWCGGRAVKTCHVCDECAVVVRELGRVAGLAVCADELSRGRGSCACVVVGEEVFASCAPDLRGWGRWRSGCYVYQ